MTSKTAEADLCKMIKELGEKYSTWQVFEDFLTLSATMISNLVDGAHWEERENLYLRTVKRYSREEAILIADMYALLHITLVEYAEEGMPDDVLGRVYHALELHNKYKGQFFTPMHVCEMMARMALCGVSKEIERYGFVTMGEPAVGSGAMIIGAARSLSLDKLDYKKTLLVTATDIDLKCVMMTYIQLSIYGISAIVQHGNGLSDEVWSRWYTPAFLATNWNQRMAERKEKEKRYASAA